MKAFKPLIAAATVAATLMLPGAASAACNVGISNNLDTVPPAAIFQGATENHNYSVSSCTIPDRITVEWVMVKNSTQSWIDNPANRTVMVAETSMGRQMQGSTSWTAPLDAQAGHYAVITRYYAQGQNYAEATAASSFNVKPDVCKNIAGGQDSIPAGSYENTPGSCIVDICPNLTGGQGTVPAGLIKDSAGNCVSPPPPPVVVTPPPVVIPPPPVVVTPPPVVIPPPPVVITPPPVVIPPPPVVVTPPPVVIPPPPVVVTPPPVVVPPTVTVVPPVVDVCPNLTGAQGSIPVNLIKDENGNCTLPLPPTGNPPTPLKPKPIITKVANRKVVTSGQNVSYTMTLRNTGKGAMLNVKMCDTLPSGTTYISHTGNAYFSHGKICWNTPRLAAGAKMTVKMTLKVNATYRGRKLVNTVCATSSNAAKVCAKATVKVIHRAAPQPGGGVTG